MVDELLADDRDAGHPHVEAKGAGGFGEVGVVEGGFFFGRVFVSGEEGELRAVVAVGDGDACVGRARDTGGDAGDDLEGNGSGGEFGSLFASASEDEGVASFETGDDFAFLRFLDTELVDFALRDGVVGGAFSGIDELAVGAGDFEKLGRGEGVVDEDVGHFDAVTAFDGEEAGVSGAGSDEVADAIFFSEVAHGVVCNEETGRIKLEMLWEKRLRAIF